MSYLLTFTEDEKRAFRVLRDGVKGSEAPKGKNDVRIYSRILRKLNKISEPIEDLLEFVCRCGRKTELPPALQIADARELKTPGYIEIDNDEKRFIEKRLEDFAPRQNFVLDLDDVYAKLEARAFDNHEEVAKAIAKFKRQMSAATSTEEDSAKKSADVVPFPKAEQSQPESIV